MADPRVQGMRNLIPRFVAAGVDFNDARRVLDRLEQWDDWAREWSAVGAEHEALATEAAAQEQWVTAGEAWLRAAVLYHFAKYLYYDHPADYRAAHDALQRAYRAAMPHLAWPVERIEVPYAGTVLPCTLRRPHGADRPPLVLLSHGLDATKEEYHVFGEAFLRRGMATLGFDGPGQGEAGFHLKIEPAYEKVVGTILDHLASRPDLDLTRVGIVGVSLGGYYAPRVAAFEPRIGAIATVGGPYDFGDCWDHLPPLSRLALLHNSGAADADEARAFAHQLTLAGIAPRVQCPALLVHGERDTLVPPSEVARLARELGGQVDMVLYPEGDHVCHNITYKYRPRVADWMAGQMRAAS
jgi:dipeptidyl aminopeptidase/acylaminoacyl peptidase